MPKWSHAKEGWWEVVKRGKKGGEMILRNSTIPQRGGSAELFNMKYALFGGSAARKAQI